jgi:hypothetical protein
MVKKKKEDKINKKVGKEEKKEVSEIFEIKKDDKEEIKKVSGTEIVKTETKNQAEDENKILRNVLLACGGLILFILIGWIVVDSARHFEYRGMEFNVIKEGKIIFYNTAFPTSNNGKYNIYIRNDPRKLEDIPFLGKIELAEYLILNSTEDFACEGKGIIAIANLQQFYQFIGVKVAKDPNATCDPQGRYMFLNIQSGEETKITQIGPSCYSLEVNDCEILLGTERFMVETFADIDSRIKKNS